MDCDGLDRIYYPQLLRKVKDYSCQLERVLSSSWEGLMADCDDTRNIDYLRPLKRVKTLLWK